jgi:hypothetical protein
MASFPIVDLSDEDPRIARLQEELKLANISYAEERKARESLMWKVTALSADFMSRSFAPSSSSPDYTAGVTAALHQVHAELNNLLENFRA